MTEHKVEIGKTLAGDGPFHGMPLNSIADNRHYVREAEARVDDDHTLGWILPCPHEKLPMRYEFSCY